jgi:hypothetical protein
MLAGLSVFNWDSPVEKNTLIQRVAKMFACFKYFKRSKVMGRDKSQRKKEKNEKGFMSIPTRVYRNGVNLLPKKVHDRM